MKQGELIDKMCKSMYKIAQDSEFGFAKFAVPWGRKDTDSYRMKQIDFAKSMRAFAKKCGIKSMKGKYYYFSGKIYEEVSEFAVCQAYDQLLEQLGIANQMLNKTARKELFLGTIMAYNVLQPRNDLQCFKNLVVDLKECDGKTLKGTHRFSKEWPVVDYHDYPYLPDAHAPLFKKFLNEVLPDKMQRDILQMFLGLGLIQTSEAFDKTTGGPRGTVELCLVLLGSGANGKSVLFNIICALFGKNHITSIDYDTITGEGDEGMRGRASIRSALFNWSSDSDAKKFGVKNTAMFKRIVSGEKYPYRLLGQDIQESANCPYLIFSLNQLPTLSEGTRGFLRRLQFVNFDVTIPRHKQDPNLAYKIIQNDLPGVFQWVLRGAKEIRRRHFQFPSSEVSLKTKIRSLLPTNPVISWMLTYSLRAEANAPTEIGTMIKSEVLYTCFKSFLENNNQDVPSIQTFGRSMSNQNFQRKKMADGIYYICYGCLEEDLRQPVLIDLIHEPEDNLPKYANDKNSFIKDD